MLPVLSHKNKNFAYQSNDVLAQPGKSGLSGVVFEVFANR